MSKQIRDYGCAYTGIGIVLVAIGLITSIEYYSSLLVCFGAAFVVQGIVRLYNYFYYKQPEHQQEYIEKQKNIVTNTNDERKIMLRDKAGHVAYQIMYFVMLGVACILVLFRIDWRMTALIFGLWVFQYICGVIVFHRLSKQL